jgi:hypothetical protein
MHESVVSGASALMAAEQWYAWEIWEMQMKI